VKFVAGKMIITTGRVCVTVDIPAVLVSTTDMKFAEPIEVI
jgi:hypothetical protein